MAVRRGRSRPVVRWLDELGEGAGSLAVRINPTGSTSQVEVYLDTDDRRFQRAGYALRVRRAGRGKGAGAEATMKELDSITTDPPGERSRHGVSERLQSADPGLLEESDGPVAVRVRAVAGSKRVRPQFEVRSVAVGSQWRQTGFLRARSCSTRSRSGRRQVVRLRGCTGSRSKRRRWRWRRSGRSSNDCRTRAGSNPRR